MKFGGIPGGNCGGPIFGSPGPFGGMPIFGPMPIGGGIGGGNDWFWSFGAELVSGGFIDGGIIPIGGAKPMGGAIPIGGGTIGGGSTGGAPIPSPPTFIGILGGASANN